MWRRNPKLLLPLSLSLAALVGLVVYFFVGKKHPDIAAAEQALAQRDFQTASEHLDRYLATQPDDAEIRLRAAQTARRRGDFTTAEEHLKRHPRHAKPDTALALEQQLLVAQRGDLRTTGELFAKYIEQPKSPETPLVLEAIIVGTLRVIDPEGTGLSPKLDADSPITSARRAVELWLQLRTNPADQAAGFAWRGRLRCLAGENTEGLMDLRKALEIDPENFEARYRIAFMFVESDPNESIRHLAFLHNRQPGNKSVQFALASGYRGVGRLEEATAILDKMLTSNPNDMSALLERANVAMDHSELAEAERYLRRALRQQPNDAETHLVLSQCLRLAGRHDEARKHWEQFERFNTTRAGGPLKHPTSGTSP